MSEIDHIGVAVASLDEGLKLWRDQLGLELMGIEEVASEGVRVAILKAGTVRVELLEPLSDDSPIARHLLKRGPGIHHLALRCDDLAATMDSLREAGCPAMDESPRPGAEGSSVTFLHPKSAGGVLVELTQPRAEEGSGA